MTDPRSTCRNDVPVPLVPPHDGRSVSVCLPARDEAGTIAAIVRSCVELRDAGIVDEVVVVDDSTDDTAAVAVAAGATVYAQQSLMSEFGPVQGKGDAMWRALSVLRGDLVVFLDADTADPGPRFVTGLLAPLRTDPRVRFVKGHYRRPLRVGDIELPTGGGRVTELTARPLLRRCFPELGGIRQPLAGEVAADRALLAALPFHLGYGVDVGLLIDAWQACGRAAIAEADLDVRRNRHQPLHDLHEMACTVAGVILDKASGIAARDEDLRPPMQTLVDPTRTAVAA
ncbi:Glucosyl-3-phosphoglycerate synthase [Paraconexibacter sp. AEG42_29]|uniref:Glucosyl-3-phosphoglycerate synthase n=1 Tax=Paraconexibacter sp. AEG42_29 TaxID=2997339 RepID=A0AAU7AUM3_9ACTN